LLIDHLRRILETVGTSWNCWHQLELLAPAGTVGIIWSQLEPVRISWKLLEIEKGAK